MDPDIHLDDLDTNTELGLIALSRNGKVYGKIGGGFMCLPMSACGFYVALRPSCEEINHHFWHEYGGQSLYYDAPTLRRTADFLDATLASYRLDDVLRVRKDSDGKSGRVYGSVLRR